MLPHKHYNEEVEQTVGSKDKLWVLLSPPGVFGGVETGQVFVLFDDIHLFTGPTKKKKQYYYDSDDSKKRPSTISKQGVENE